MRGWPRGGARGWPAAPLGTLAGYLLFANTFDALGAQLANMLFFTSPAQSWDSMGGPAVKIALLGPYPLDPAAPAGQPPLPGGVEAVVLALARGLAQQRGWRSASSRAARPGAHSLWVAGDGFPIFCMPAAAAAG